MLSRLLAINFNIADVSFDSVSLHCHALVHQHEHHQLSAFSVHQCLIDEPLERGAVQHDFVSSYHHAFSTIDSLMNNVGAQLAENAANA